MTATLRGKRALVTGGASGIGLATAGALASSGADVVIADVDDERGRDSAHKLGASYVRLDVSDPDRWRTLLADFGQLDLLHLNAGVYDIELSDITAISDARYRTYMGANIDGVFLGLRAAIPLLECSRGSVVVTGSVAGTRPLAANPLYALTKFALTGFVRSVHPDLKRRGIRLNMLCPGAVATPIMGDDPHKWYTEHGVPAAEPEDMAATIVELLSSDRSGEILLQIPPHPPRTLDFTNP